MSKWLKRQDASMPYQTWKPYPDHAIVQVKNVYGDTRVGPAHKFWWGYERETDSIGEGVIYYCRRLDKRKA